jgi:pyrroline-5-carboxylate reductase
MPNTTQKIGDATMSVIQDEWWHKRRRAAHKVTQQFAAKYEWPEEDLAMVMMALGLDNE